MFLREKVHREFAREPTVSKKEKPRYEYFCATCSGSVTKSPVGSSEGKVKSGLHGWKCSVDGPSKVVRKLKDKS